MRMDESLALGFGLWALGFRLWVLGSRPAVFYHHPTSLASVASFSLLPLCPRCRISAISWRIGCAGMRMSLLGISVQPPHAPDDPAIAWLAVSRYLPCVHQ